MAVNLRINQVKCDCCKKKRHLAGGFFVDKTAFRRVLQQHSDWKFDGKRDLCPDCPKAAQDESGIHDAVVDVYYGMG